MKPVGLDDFSGQDSIRDTLGIFINAAKAREEMLEHVLLYGPPGLGKTTLASIIAHEMGVGFQAIAAPAITKSADLASVLTNIREPHILFVDEIHRLNVASEEMLYSAMDERRISVIIGEGVTARTMTLTLSPFTLIGATTRLSLLGAPFRDRFGIHIRLDFYDESALSIIIQRAATAMGAQLLGSTARIIAGRSRGTPRIALRLLRRTRDFAENTTNPVIDEATCMAALSNLGIDAMGLDHYDRRYLELISKCGGFVGLNTIAVGLNERKETVEEAMEPYLIRSGLVKKTSRGRALTEKAIEHLMCSLNLPKI